MNSKYSKSNSPRTVPTIIPAKVPPEGPAASDALPSGILLSGIPELGTVYSEGLGGAGGFVSSTYCPGNEPPGMVLSGARGGKAGGDGFGGDAGAAG